ncbi:hypothetical protein MAHJHV61_35710 [Mycobacterium avium subsp. hominissuis]
MANDHVVAAAKFTFALVLADLDRKTVAAGLEVIFAFIEVELIGCGGGGFLRGALRGHRGVLQGHRVVVGHDFQFVVELLSAV